MAVELRRQTVTGWTYRTVDIAAVEAEVASFARASGTLAVELRAVGADQWRRVA
jgi:hypothetical protein